MVIRRTRRRTTTTKNFLHSKNMQSKIKHLHSKNIEKNHASHIECNSTVNHDLLYQKMSSKNKISA